MRYLTIMNIAGEVHRIYRTANSLAKAERLARISVAKEKGLIPSPWAINPSEIRTTEAPKTVSGHA